MKIQFESNLNYQDQAISSIVDIFEGQEVCQSNFSIVRQQIKGKQQTSGDYDDLGIGNRLELLDDELL
jgi:type III restriction enzyme